MAEKVTKKKQVANSTKVETKAKKATVVKEAVKAEAKLVKAVKKTVEKEVVAQKNPEFKVFVRNVQESPLKLRLVANLVRGKRVENALTQLEFLNKKGSLFIKKAIVSGIANAKQNTGIEKKDLYVKHISIGEGDNLKRFKIASRSRVAGIVKRRSHINLVLSVK